MEDQRHFDKLFWFCVAICGIGLAYLITLTFVAIPKGSERFADNCQGFFQGSIITAAVSFLLGGNIPINKKPTTTVTKADVVNVIPTDPQSQDILPPR